jgi:cytochrome c peroxidase
MKKLSLLVLLVAGIIFFTTSFKDNSSGEKYDFLYNQQMHAFQTEILQLKEELIKPHSIDNSFISDFRLRILKARVSMKSTDFWTRYMNPLAYKSINGPLPVEWETEVFEKFEKPYKRMGAGLTLALQYLEEENFASDSLLNLINPVVGAIDSYLADSTAKAISSYHHFYLCNRLYLLNLASIYTTGFECPDTSLILPELKGMLQATGNIYESFNRNFPQTPLTNTYLILYNNLIAFVDTQDGGFGNFDHYDFIRDFINPLFRINQQLIRKYKVLSNSVVDYSIEQSAQSIFSKDLYQGENSRGVFLRVDDEIALKEIDSIGKLFFYDPILSGNNKRSCASCHKPKEYFTDTSQERSLGFNQKDRLQRNTPSLINTPYNHLLMLDGKHISLQNQARDVITSSLEMGSEEKEVMKKVLSCAKYKTALKKLESYTPELGEISMDHIISAITTYYSKFSNAYSAFDDAMNMKTAISQQAEKGFNIFMGKAQCATCHFVPQFNGVKPPYIGSEFEVLGVPADTNYSGISMDSGRYKVNKAWETLFAFRTGSLRNISHTAPYMHNGVFKTLEEVIDFYNAGGGAGKGLKVPNQTLAAEKLNLSDIEKQQLIAFLKSLDEKIIFEPAPNTLPLSRINKLNSRKVGGEY